MSLEREIRGKETEIRCPNCGASFRARVLDLLKRNHTVTCPHCNLTMKSQGGIEEADRLLRKFQRNIRRLNAKLRL